LETYYDVERDYLFEALFRVAFSKTVGLEALFRVAFSKTVGLKFSDI